MADNQLAGAVRSGNYTAAVKLIDLALRDARAAGSASLGQMLCNRAYCYHQLGLLRKAIKVQCSLPVQTNGVIQCSLDSFAWLLTTLQSLSQSWSSGQRCPQLVPSWEQDYDEALSLEPTCCQALVRKGKVLLALKKEQVCPAGRAQSGPLLFSVFWDSS